MGGSVTECIAQVHRAIDGLDLGQVAEGEHAEVLRQLERAKRRIEAASLKVLAAADKARVGERAGLTGTGAWAAATTHCGGAEGSAQSALAVDITERLPETGRSLEAGTISSEHAKVIATAIRRLPPDLDQREREAIEARLVRQARSVDPTRLRILARRALEAAERSRRAVDEHEDSILRGEEQRALSRTRLSMRDNGDGTTTGHFTVPTLAGSILQKVIQQIASPRRDRERDTRAGRIQGAEDGTDRYADTDWAHRYGLAFLEVLEHLPTDRLHGKVAATVVATMELDSLRNGIKSAHLDTGQAISAGAARRLACNAGLVPAVLGGASVPLDLGRANRFFSEAQRVALATTYTECAADGCDRPYAWSELHHEDPWAHDGHTDLDRAVPLCGYHHRRIHDPRFASQVMTDSSGVKTVRLREW